MLHSKSVLIGLVVAAVTLVSGAVAKTNDGYQVTMVLPNANNLFEGASVMRDGFEAGSVKQIEVVDGKAQVTLDLDTSYGALHEGARAEVVWKALLGERMVNLADGEGKSEIPSGSMLTEVMAEPVELTHVLAALDPPTRDKVNSLVKRLSATTSGREKQIQETLQTAGPAVRALGEVLDDLGADGEAIKQILIQSNDTMEILASRQESVAQIVGDLDAMSSTLVQRREQLSQTLDRLPGTISSAETVLADVPDTVDAALPLLEDLDPATEALVPAAKHLRPVLQDLRPATAELRPTLESLSTLLQDTPALLDSGTATLPDANQAVKGLTPAVDFLRPYTPELTGWLSNWGSAGGNYDSNGHYARFHVLTGTESALGLGAAGPGVTQNLKPKPGNPVGQPWNDAYGEGIR